MRSIYFYSRTFPRFQVWRQILLHIICMRSFGGVKMTYFEDTSMLMSQQKVAPVTSCDDASKQMQIWDIFCGIFIEYSLVHLTIFEVQVLIEELSIIRSSIYEQDQHQPSSPVAFLRLIQTGFNQIFCQSRQRRHRALWVEFEWIHWALATRNFRHVSVVIPESLTPSTPPPLSLVLCHHWWYLCINPRPIRTDIPQTSSSGHGA